MATNDFVAFDSVTSIVERKISKVSLIGLKSNLLDKKVRFQAWLKRKEWRKRVGGFSPDGGLVDANDSRRRSLLELSLDDLLGPGTGRRENASNECPSRRRPLAVVVPLGEIRSWCRDRMDRLRELRRQRAAALLKSKIAFGIIVFVGVVTAIQLIPPILRFFRR